MDIRENRICGSDMLLRVLWHTACPLIPNRPQDNKVRSQMLHRASGKSLLASDKLMLDLGKSLSTVSKWLLSMWLVAKTTGL
jgi:hypothetical protein